MGLIEQSPPSDSRSVTAYTPKTALENDRTWWLLIFIGLAVAFAAFCDWVFAGLMPFTLYLVYIAACILVLLPLAGWRPSRNNRLNGLILISFAAIVLVLYVVPSKRERFLHDLHRVKPGMTRTEAEAIMSKYDRSGGQPDPERSTFTGSRSADFGVVSYENNRVITVEFLPD